MSKEPSNKPDRIGLDLASHHNDSQITLSDVDDSSFDVDDTIDLDAEPGRPRQQYFEAATTRGYIPVDSNNQRRISPSQLFYWPSLFRVSRDSYLPIVVSCLMIAIVALAMLIGAFRIGRHESYSSYKPNPMVARVQADDWVFVDGGRDHYKFLKSDVGVQAKDRLQIGRRREILESGKFKVYVYPMTPQLSGEEHYKTTYMSTDLGFSPNLTLWDWCLTSYYSYEITFTQFLLSNPYNILTTDPTQASLFYIPLLSACEFWRTGWPGLDNITDWISTRIFALGEEYPSLRDHFAGRLPRRDHLLTLGHDWGTLYAPAWVVERVVAIVQLSRGHGNTTVAYGTESVVVPPFSKHPGEVEPVYDVKGWTFGFRENFAYFAGTCAPADPTRMEFCAQLRHFSTKLPTHFPIPPSILLPGPTYATDAEISSNMRKSTFCLAPRGWTPTSTRLFDAVFEGCIPVLIGGLGNETTILGLDFPFQEMLPGLRAASVAVSEDQIVELDEVLLSITEEEVVRKQLILAELGRWSFAYRRALQEKGGYCGEDCGKYGRESLDVQGEEGWDAFEYWLLELAARADTLGLVA